MDEKYFQQNKHYYCTKCGTRSPLSAKYCENYSCHALLAVYGLAVDPIEDEKRRMEEEAERDRLEREEKRRREEDARRRREQAEWERQQAEAARRQKEEDERRREEQAEWERQQAEAARRQKEEAERRRKEQEEWEKQQAEQASRQEAGRKAKEQAERKAQEEAAARQQEEEKGQKEKNKKKRGGCLKTILGVFAAFIVLFVMITLLKDCGSSSYNSDTGTDTKAEDTDTDDTDREDTDSAADANEEVGDSRIMMTNTSLGNVLGNDDYDRDDIQSVTFLDSTADAGEDAWDVSQEEDQSVLAWTAEADDGLYDLYIAAEGGVIAPESCYRLFASYDYLESIDFNGCLDTSGVENMRGMFNGCTSLKSIDLSQLDTSNVTNMSAMFAYVYEDCEIDLTELDTSSVTDMAYMFYGISDDMADYLLEEEYGISALDVSSVTRYEYFMWSEVSAKNESAWDWMFENVDGDGTALTANCLGGLVTKVNDEIPYPAENLFDGDSSTVWCVTEMDTVDEVYVIWDMGEAVTIDGIFLISASDTTDYPHLNPYSWVLYGIEDDYTLDTSEWTQLVHITEQDVLGEKNNHEVLINASKVSNEAFRYFKLVIEEAVSGYEFQLGEVRLFY